MKDLFIDNNIAKNFANPLDIEYKKLVKWLLQPRKNNTRANAYLVASNHLSMEYGRTCCGAGSSTSIPVIIGKLQADGRLRKFTNKQIKTFKARYCSARVKRRLTCNYDDREFHIPTVLMSYRKYALSRDGNFRTDLINFPGFTVLAEKRPQDLPYAK